MKLVWIAALMIGGTTLLGTGCGFLFSRISPRWNSVAVAFAAGVMLAAAAFGLFLPAMEMATNPLHVLMGALGGMVFLRCAGILMNRMGHRQRIARHPELMFVLALIMHKFPEGMAGGVGLGADAPGGLMVAIGVALQNLPEGMVMIPPLLGAGMGRGRAALIALLTGLLNALGVLAGAAWGMLAVWFLPLALAFAGGAMLDVIVGCMIPGISGENVLPGGRWILMGGFLLMTGVNMLF